MIKNKKILNKITNPSDIKGLSLSELSILAEELRIDLINIISKTGGHLGAGLGVIELTIALHYVFDHYFLVSPIDLLSHQYLKDHL